MSDKRTITLPRNGTLPTLEKLLTEMAALEEQTVKVEKHKNDAKVLIEENKKLCARNSYLERENNTLKLDRNSRTTHSFDFPSPGPEHNIQLSTSPSRDETTEMVIFSRRHPAHEDDRTIVKVVTTILFIFLPLLIGVGVWAACLLDQAKIWYDTKLDSPIKLPFFILGPVWCVVYATLGLNLYSAWYQLGARRGLPYIVNGLCLMILCYAWVPTILVGHWILPTFVIMCCAWAMLLIGVMMYARVSFCAGLTLLPCLIWTTYTGMFLFFPFHDRYFGDSNGNNTTFDLR